MPCGIWHTHTHHTTIWESHLYTNQCDCYITQYYYIIATIPAGGEGRRREADRSTPQHTEEEEEEAGDSESMSTQLLYWTHTQDNTCSMFQPTMYKADITYTNIIMNDKIYNCYNFIKHRFTAQYKRPHIHTLCRYNMIFSAVQFMSMWRWRRDGGAEPKLVSCA